MTKAEQKSNLLVLCVDTCRNNRATHHNTPTLPLENNQIHRRRKREARVTTDASKTIFNGRTTRHYCKRLARLFAWFFWRYRWSCIYKHFQYLLRRACLDGIGRRVAVRHNCLSAIVRRRCLTTSSMIGYCTCFWLIRSMKRASMVIDRCKRTGRNINEERELTWLLG